MIQKFTHGNRGTRDRLNEMVDELNRLTRARGGGVVAHNNMASGRVTSLLHGQTQSRYGSLLYMNTQSSLIARWPFSSADGDEDIAGRGYDGTFAGNANTDYDCLQLDGTGDYVNLDAHVTSLRTLNQGTISFWMNPTLLNRVPFSLTHGTQPLADGSFYINYNIKQIQMYCYDVLNATSPIMAIPYNRWVHIAYVSDATGNALYIDGAAVALTYTFGTSATQCFLGDATPDSDDPADAMRIGHVYFNSAISGEFRGGIADFRIYNRGLTHAEIVGLYHSTNRYVIHANEIFGAARIFEVQGEDTGDGIYNCYEQVLDATEWDDTTGGPTHTKIDDIASPPTVEVLNLAEFAPEATYVAHLAAGDLLLAFRYWDDEAGFRWVGVPFFADTNEGRLRRAFVKTTPTGTTVDLYLDSDASSVEVTITPDQAGTAGAGPYNLDECIPRLLDGDPLTVYSLGGSWYCTTIFQPIDHAKGLRVEAATEKLAVNIDTTQMQFDAGDDDQLKTNLDECP